MNCKYLCLSLPSPALFVNGDSKEERLGRHSLLL